MILKLKSKEINRDTAEFFSFLIPKNLIEDTPDACRNIYGAIPPRGLENFTRIFGDHGNSRVSSVLTISQKDKKIELILKKDLWVK